MRIAVVVGNPKLNSRTLVIARSVAKAAAAALGGEIAVEVDLALSFHEGRVPKRCA
jgi:hypothetical protein